MASVRCGRWRVRRVGGGNNPDEASVLDKIRTRVRRDERASSTDVWFGGGRAKSVGEEFAMKFCEGSQFRRGLCFRERPLLPLPATT